MRFYTVIVVPPEVPTLAEALNDAEQAGWTVLQVLQKGESTQLIAYEEVDPVQFDRRRRQREGATTRVTVPGGEAR